MTRIIRVGGARTEFAMAKEFAQSYLTPPPRLADTRWAYPAYDGYPGTPSSDVGAQDLLAPFLLNVNQKPLPTYYALLDALPEINRRLNSDAIAGTLMAADATTIDAISHLFGILDVPGLKNVRLTKFSKVLHRKRPSLIPLYDTYIWNCYTQIEPIRVAPDKSRSWADFTRVWLLEVQRDLRAHADEWAEIASIAQSPPITDLRALDIVGWYLGGPDAPGFTN